MSTEEKAKVMNEDAIKEIEELEESASHSGDDFQYEPVPEGKRQNWYDLVFVWFGAAMVAQLYQAGVTVTIGTGGLPNGLKAILGGALFLALFTALSGYVGYKTLEFPANQVPMEGLWERGRCDPGIPHCGYRLVRCKRGDVLLDFGNTFPGHRHQSVGDPDLRSVYH